MAEKLGVYNLALAHLRQRRLGALTDNVESRRVLDDLWDQVVSEALAEGLWNFMLRAIRIDTSTTVTPGFGWSYAFKIPDDWVRTVMVSSDETFIQPLLDYAEEAGYWYANFTPLYVKLISSDPLYGMNLGTWPPNFTAWVSFHLAEYGAGRIAGAAANELLTGPAGVIERGRKAKIKAKSTDAMNQPPGQMPAGTWVRSRRGFLRGTPAPGGSGGSSYDD